MTTTHSLASPPAARPGLIADALRTPARHGALVAFPGAAPLVARRRAMADASLDHATRQRAAHWLRQNGAPADRAAAQRYLSGETS